MIELDKDYVSKKLGWTIDEFDALLNNPIKSHFEYKSYITKHYVWLSKITSLYKKK